MQLDSKLRDELAKIAVLDFQGVPLGGVVNRLIKGHKILRVMRPAVVVSSQAHLRIPDRRGADRAPDHPRPRARAPRTHRLVRIRTGPTELGTHRGHSCGRNRTVHSIEPIGSASASEIEQLSEWLRDMVAFC